MRVTIFFLSALLGLPIFANSLPSEQRKNNKLVQAALSPVQLSLQSGSAVFYNDSDRKPFLYGTVVSPDGYILTKASELELVEEFHVRIDEERYRELKVVAIDTVWDLALVKAEATELTPVVWAPSSDLAHGTWVVSNGATERRYRRPRPGIISANKRAISGGTQMVLGVGLKDTDEGIVITSITEGSGAEKAKLQKGDLIIKVDDQDSKKREDFVELIKEKTAEDSIELVVKRDEETLTLDVELTSRYKLYGGSKSRNDQMSGGDNHISRRRTGFPMVIQHETQLTRRSVGGPLLTFDGECVGLNIAAVNRVEVYAIPVENLLEVLSEMMEEAEANGKN